MAKAVNIKNLAEGQLAAATGDMYTVPATTQAIVRLIELVNTHTVAVTVNLYEKPGETDRRIIPKDVSLEANGGKLTLKGIRTLEAADKIRGDASVAEKVDYIIKGVEES